MKTTRRHLVACAAWAVCFSVTATAQTFPDKPIRAIVPFTAGTSDTLARLLGDELTKIWGQPLIVENRPGAGATIGAAVAANAAPDGYTWLMATSAHAISMTLYPNLTYGKSDFQAVSLMATTPLVLSVSKSVQAKSLPDLISLAKAKPRQTNFASAGTGSPSHMAGELFISLANVEVTHIPYKGAAPAVNDLMGGRVEMLFDPLPSSLPHIRAGSFRALAVSSDRRSPLLPEVQTFKEGGLAGYQVYWWAGIVVPSRTPRAVVVQIHKAVATALSSPGLRKRLTDLGYEVIGSTPEEFTRYIDSEIKQWAEVAKKANVQIQ